ncbi:MAG: TIGR02584 family CRISPR-associated protein [Azonexus sp.]|jgi:CRISPR-associated protein (TIGR02584 family)|uniref:CRISPR-associated ring nuclease Csm6 n=1 Tax=Azonexus sp. TaxID=1872668 RepID=UPI0028227A80|nr:CRISPR-associated ring nuclease Csm6 [Azonexus sp.]MDR0776277.1 TIGR02584 family CRISPR-associated protein [Azonexus sp.]
MKTPNQFPRRILLCITGMTPQIVTETLYALAFPKEQASAFVPTEIHLLSTSEGARHAEVSLLHADGGQFHALLKDYPALGRPAFDKTHIHVIPGPDGKPLSDIRTPEDNAAAADAITTKLAELTRDGDAALHASIAGGRKTMGFYLGYAFSLYAREQDRLSHVLVSPAFETHPEFFYPPPKSRRLATREGTHIDTAGAQVMLAEIPIVRLRHGLPEKFAKGESSYIDTVQAIQESFAPPSLEIDLQARRASCGQHSLQLTPSLIAWLGFWAQTALDGKAFRRWRDIEPDEFLHLYQRVIGIDAGDYENAKKRLQDGMEKTFFEENNSKLNSKLKRALGPAAAPYLITSQGTRGHTERGLTVPAAAITLK